MATIEEIEAQLRERQQAGADLIVECAWAIHREQRQLADARKTIEQYSAIISGQNATISELRAEIDKLRSEQTQK
jgi:hypothetical protein